MIKKWLNNILKIIEKGNIVCFYEIDLIRKKGGEMM